MCYISKIFPQSPSARHFISYLSYSLSLIFSCSPLFLAELFWTNPFLLCDFFFILGLIPRAFFVAFQSFYTFPFFFFFFLKQHYLNCTHQTRSQQDFVQNHLHFVITVSRRRDSYTSRITNLWCSACNTSLYIFKLNWLESSIATWNLMRHPTKMQLC